MEKFNGNIRDWNPRWVKFFDNMFKNCINFLDTRVELDQNGFKFDIFEH